MYYVYFVSWLFLILFAVSRLLLYKRDPLSSWSWLFFILFVPYAGAILFLIFSPQRLERKATKRKKRIERRRSAQRAANVVKDAVSKHVTNFEEKEVFHLARQISDYPLTDGNAIEIYPDPYKALQSMQEAIAKAKSFIHLEYYIIEYDEVTANLFECLLEAAHRGVEIRILYDSLGSIFLKQTYFRKLIQAGAKTAGFLPLSFVRLNPNFRNHRKLLIVDGEIGFTGGTNLSRNYLGRRHESSLHDYTARVLGPAINQLQAKL